MSLFLFFSREDESKLFEYWCEISPNNSTNLQSGSSGGGSSGAIKSGQIVESFPDGYKDPKILSDIPDFAFPCQFEKYVLSIHPPS